MSQLRDLALENGRFNIGEIVGTFNEPTLALLFLDEPHRGRFTFTPGGRQTVKDRQASRYHFVERSSPTVIQSRDRDVPARGTVWIESGSGSVFSRAGEQVTGVATYSDFRRFETAGRLVVPD